MARMRSALRAAAPLAAAIACSAPSTSPTTASPLGSVDGAVSGHTLGVTDGIAATNPTSAIPYVDVVLGNRTRICPLLQGAGTLAPASSQVANLTVLEFHIYDTRTATFNTGTFPVPPPNPTVTPVIEADVFFSSNGSALSDAGPGCQSEFFQWASSGAVTVTALQPTVVGSYDLMFGSAHVTGAFDVSYCSNVNIQGTGDGAGGGTPAVCEP